jgi:hypothetical protein
MGYAYLKIKEIRLTGADFETEDYNLQCVVNSTPQAIPVTLRRNHYAILDIRLKEQQYTTEHAVTAVLTIEHAGLSVASAPSTFSMNFSSSTTWGTAEKELTLVHPTDSSKVQTFVVVYEFTPFPALISEYKAMVDCLKRLHEFRDVFADNLTISGWLTTLESSDLSELFGAYEDAAGALSISVESYDEELTMGENVMQLDIVNEQVYTVWDETTVGTTIISDLQSKFNAFKSTFDQIIAALHAMGLFLCDKYYRWKGPGELFDNYEELAGCLCEYETQYMTLVPDAKTKINGLRTQMADYLTQLYDYAFSKGYVGSIPSTLPTNMCDLYKHIKTILNWLKADYNRRIA